MPRHPPQALSSLAKIESTLSPGCPGNGAVTSIQAFSFERARVASAFNCQRTHALPGHRPGRNIQGAFRATARRLRPPVGGDDRDRTDDLRLAKPALSQLSYIPVAAGRVVGPGGVEPPTSRLSGVRSNHLSYEPE